MFWHPIDLPDNHDDSVQDCEKLNLKCLVKLCESKKTDHLASGLFLVRAVRNPI